MDANVEDKMLHQIEKNLSNHINENLFVSGRIYEDNRAVNRNNTASDNSIMVTEGKSELPEPIKEDWEYGNSFPQLSRAEYIRQAREACLRQMNTVQGISKGMDNLLEESEDLHPALTMRKRSKAGIPMQDTSEEENTTLEAAAFRSLIIRTVCAIVIFVSIFVIDKFQFKWGDFSYQKVQEFVTGKDNLVELEDLIVSLLKNGK